MTVFVGLDSARTRRNLEVGGKTFAYYSLAAAEAAGLGQFSRLPAALKVVLENMLRFEDVPDKAGFRFGKPEKGYLNKGLFRGGDIEWQGWVVDLAIESTTVFGQPHTDEYVVRMNDGDVVEVLEKRYSSAIRRVSQDEAWLGLGALAGRDPQNRAGGRRGRPGGRPGRRRSLNRLDDSSREARLRRTARTAGAPQRRRAERVRRRACRRQRRAHGRSGREAHRTAGRGAGADQGRDG